MLRVGPLARMNVIDGIGTPRANEEWAEFRALERGAVLSSFHYHYARLIEILFGLERMDAAPPPPGHPLEAGPRPRAPEQLRGDRRLRGAPRDAHPPLPDRRERPDRVGQPHHRDRLQQPRDEPRDPPGRAALHQQPGDPGGDAQPRRGRHPQLRPLPLLLHARRGRDAPRRRAEGRRAGGSSTGRPADGSRLPPETPCGRGRDSGPPAPFVPAPSRADRRGPRSLLTSRARAR